MKSNHRMVKQRQRKSCANSLQVVSAVLSNVFLSFPTVVAYYRFLSPFLGWPYRAVSCPYSAPRYLAQSLLPQALHPDCEMAQLCFNTCSWSELYAALPLTRFYLFHQHWQNLDQSFADERRPFCGHLAFRCILTWRRESNLLGARGTGCLGNHGAT